MKTEGIQVNMGKKDTKAKKKSNNFAFNKVYGLWQYKEA